MWKGRSAPTICSARLLRGQRHSPGFQRTIFRIDCALKLSKYIKRRKRKKKKKINTHSQGEEQRRGAQLHCEQGCARRSTHRHCWISFLIGASVAYVDRAIEFYVVVSVVSRTRSLLHRRAFSSSFNFFVVDSEVKHNDTYSHRAIWRRARTTLRYFCFMYTSPANFPIR